MSAFPRPAIVAGPKSVKVMYCVCAASVVEGGSWKYKNKCGCAPYVSVDSGGRHSMCFRPDDPAVSSNSAGVVTPARADAIRFKLGFPGNGVREKREKS